MTLLGGECETPEIEVDYSRIHPRRDHVSRRLQEEATTTVAATPTAATGTDRVHHGQPEQRGQGDVDDADMADHERDRRQHRRHWRGSAERLAASNASRLDDLSSGCERGGRNAGGHGASD